MTDNPRDEVTLTKSSSVGVSGSAFFVCLDCGASQPEPGGCGRCPGVVVSGSASDEARKRAEYVLSFVPDPKAEGDYWTDSFVTALARDVVGLSADVSRLTAEKNEWMAKWERERVEREALEASLRDAGDAKP